MRPYFTAHLEQAAAACDVPLRWLCEGWVAQLARSGHLIHVIGYAFPLNDAAAAQIANDKTATYTLLDDCHVPAIPHRVLRPCMLPPGELSAHVLGLVPLPLVAKPLAQCSGADVFRARDTRELHDVLGALAQRHRVLTVSPYVEIAHEYRVIVLDQRVYLIYEKHRTTDWRHNLHRGAVPRLVGSGLVDSGPVVTALSALARQATRALNLRFAAVDVVDVHGRLAVLEVNNTVSLERFSSHAPAYADLARDVYRDAVAACVTRLPPATAPRVHS